MAGYENRQEGKHVGKQRRWVGKVEVGKQKGKEMGGQASTKAGQWGGWVGKQRRQLGRQDGRRVDE